MSYYEDEGQDLEAEAWILDEALSNPKKWVSQDGTDTPIKSMDTKHLMNLVDGIHKGKRYNGQAWKLDELRAELKRRQQ